ncbi:MAG: alpha/beta hydrolase [Treponema sp.]|nr:alpha/beta hydrolase [Treponema sp.]
MSLVRKQIPLSEFENEALAGRKGISLIFRLPFPIMRKILLRKIEIFRNPQGIALPIIPDCNNEISYKKIEIKGAHNPVGISIYEPKSSGSVDRSLFLFIHGGAFLGGDSQINEGLMRLIADRTNAITAAVDYNVSPEVQHPVPLNECREALQYLLDNYPINNRLIFLAGDSAGGNLAAALTLKLIDEGGPVPRGQILLYPVCDLARLDRESYLQKGREYFILRRVMLVSRSVYLSDKKSRKSPYVSPIYANFDKAQPDALLLIAERDPLRSDGLDYGEKLRQAGGYARTVLYEGSFHAFINDLRRSDIADDAAEEIIMFINERIS